MKDGKFEVRDIIRGKENIYSITNKNMYRAEVISLHNNNEKVNMEKLDYIIYVSQGVSK